MQRVRSYAPVRGDIIMFRTADDPPLRFIKRVIAEPGEAIEIRAGRVFINQQPLPEPYTTINPAWSLAATNVPPGKVYVIGDNRDVPMEVAVQGLVATRLVQAKMVAHWRWRK
jgi:signal peptidase I